MESYRLLSFILVILATCLRFGFSDDPIRYVVKEMGESLVINCTSRPIPNTMPLHWVLTDLTVLDSSNQNAEFLLVDYGLQLRITKVDENAIGDYFCVLKRTDTGGNDTLLYFKSTVEKYEKSTWEEYRTQTIVGIVAAVVTLVVMTGLCLVWRYRWRPEEPETVAVNGGYDTADPYYPEKEKDKGFINESFANSNPTPTNGVITDDTKF